MGIAHNGCLISLSPPYNIHIDRVCVILLSGC